jgi:hypothetical protein
MDTKELPAHPSLEQYKKQAKELLKSVKAGDTQPLQDILQRLKKDHQRPGRLTELERKGTKLFLADVQFLIARDYGFESWPKLAKYIEGIARRSSAATFEAAVDAIVNGDSPELERLLKETPDLVRARSARLHQATLLHYVGANGVENYRQKTPKNAVQVAEVLLRAGADVNATADIYRGSDTLGLVATSIFPALAGVQNELIDLLLQHGAKLNDERLVNACLANGRGQAAEHLAKRGAPLDLEGAAGVGRLDLVKTYFEEDGGLKANATKKQMERGFLWACEYGRDDVVDFLLQNGLRVDAMPHGETGLHWAAFGGHVAIVKRLLQKRAPLGVKDKRYGGTPLDWALHGWNDPPIGTERGYYYEVVAILASAGARVDPAWLDSGRPLAEKVRKDPRMIAALRNKTLPQ